MLCYSFGLVWACGLRETAWALWFCGFVLSMLDALGFGLCCEFAFSGGVWLDSLLCCRLVRYDTLCLCLASGLFVVRFWVLGLWLVLVDFLVLRHWVLNAGSGGGLLGGAGFCVVWGFDF